MYDYGDYDYNPGDFTVNPLIALLGTNSSAATVKPSSSANNHSSSNDTNSQKYSTSKPSVGTHVYQQSNQHRVSSTKSNATSLSPLLAALSNTTRSAQSLGSHVESPIKILVKPAMRRFLKRKRNKPFKRAHKAPFRLRAVYRRPQRVQVVPRKVLNEFVIEAPSNDHRGDEDDDDEIELEEPEPEEIEIEEDDDDDEYEGSPDGNTNKKKKKKQKKRKKNKKKVPYEYYEHEYEPEPYIQTIYRPAPVLEYELIDDHEEDEDFFGLKQSSL